MLSQLERFWDCVLSHFAWIWYNRLSISKNNNSVHWILQSLVIETANSLILWCNAITRYVYLNLLIGRNFDDTSSS